MKMIYYIMNVHWGRFKWAYYGFVSFPSSDLTNWTIFVALCTRTHVLFSYELLHVTRLAVYVERGSFHQLASTHLLTKGIAFRSDLLPLDGFWCATSHLYVLWCECMRIIALDHSIWFDRAHRKPHFHYVHLRSPHLIRTINISPKKESLKPVNHDISRAQKCMILVDIRGPRRTTTSDRWAAAATAVDETSAPCFS